MNWRISITTIELEAAGDAVGAIGRSLRLPEVGSRSSQKSVIVLIPNADQACIDDLAMRVHHVSGQSVEPRITTNWFPEDVQSAGELLASATRKDDT
jgi:hypothetical protein